MGYGKTDEKYDDYELDRSSSIKSLADSISEAGTMSEYTVEVEETHIEEKPQKIPTAVPEMGVETSFVRRGISRFFNVGEVPDQLQNDNCGSVSEVDLDQLSDKNIMMHNTTRTTDDEDEESFRLREEENGIVPFSKVVKSKPSTASIALKFFLIFLLFVGAIAASFFASRAIISHVKQNSADNSNSQGQTGTSATSTETTTGDNQSQRSNEISQLVQSISNVTLLEDPSTPQSQAFKWITFNDPQQLSLTGKNNVTKAKLAQRYIMSLLYYSLNGHGMQNSSMWLSKSGECNWYQVSCSKNNRVIKIDLSGQNLTGTIPSEISYLTNLEELLLNNNAIQGRIPSTIGGLENLITFDVGTNIMTGNLPVSFFTLMALQVAVLSDNRFKGSLSSSIGNLTNLEQLMLQKNAFNEKVPEEVGKLTKLVELDLHRNYFAGEFPFKSLTTLTSLVHLDLSKNYITGSLPNALGKMTDLSYLALNENSFSGGIPSIIGDISKLQVLQLNGNTFTGNIPKALGSLQNLETLALQDNNLTGTVPNDVCSLTTSSLTELTSDCLQAVKCQCCTKCY